MANRYWVGGSGNWNDTAHWAVSSGGIGGASLPTSATNVFVDENSDMAGGTITMDDIGYCYNFTSTVGDAWTLTKVAGDDYFRVFGSLSLGETIDATGSFIQFFGAETGLTIDTHGSTFGQVSIVGTRYGSAGGWTLLSDLTSTGYFSFQTGTFDANDFNVTASNFYIQSAITDWPDATLTMGNGIWEATGSGSAWSLVEYGNPVTLNAEGSTIKLSDATSSQKNFNGLGKTYNNVLIVGSGTGVYEIKGNNTFNDFSVENPPHTIKFLEETTQTFNTFDMNGSAGNLNVIDSAIDTGLDAIIDTYTTGLDANISIKASAYYAGGQIVQGDGRAIRNLVINLNKVLSPTGNLYAKIYASTGTPGTNAIGFGSPLATSDAVLAQSLPNGNANATFTFTENNRIILEDGVWYAILVFAQVGDDSNYIAVGLDSTSPTHGGNYCQYNGSSWQYSASYDCIFTINAQPGQHTLSKASGTVNGDYLDISNSNATGGATWYAGSHSVDTANNNGWIFDDAPTEQKISPLPTHFNL